MNLFAIKFNGKNKAENWDVLVVDKYLLRFSR